MLIFFFSEPPFFKTLNPTSFFHVVHFVTIFSVAQEKHSYTGMRGISTFRPTTDRIYDGGPIKL
jgi:hypothetical protein